MTTTAAARTALFDALSAAFADTPVAVEQYRPLELTVPVVFVGIVGRRLDLVDGAPVVVVTFPVTAIVDGADDAQVAALDDIGDVIWRVALDLSATPTASAANVDVDGPTLHAVVTAVDVETDHLTLCPDPE